MNFIPTFRKLPSPGDDPREVARVVNQISDYLFLRPIPNATVFDFTIPANALDAGNYVVQNPSILPQSMVLLEPQNAVAELATIFVDNQIAGQFEIVELPAEFRAVAAQVEQIDGSMGSLVGGAQIPFDTSTFTPVNCVVDTVLDRITFNTSVMLQYQFTISGNYATGTDYEFGISLYDSSDVLKGTFTVKTSTSNQNDVISVSGSILSPNAAPGDYIEVYGSATSAGLFDPYDLTLSVVSPFAGAIHVTDEMQFRCLVVDNPD